MSYLAIALVAPIALVAAPLAVLLFLQRSSRWDAVVAVIIAAVVVGVSAGPADSFDQLERAWLVLLSAGVAAVVLAGRPRGFVPAALTAVAGAGLAAALLAVATNLSWGKLIWLAERHYGLQVSWVLGQVAQAPGGADLLASLEGSLALGVKLVSQLFPGLVLLQSVAALALAWALYHRIAREPMGESVGTLAAFRFNDHLIWGVAGSLLVLVLPRLGWVSALGGNLLVFFSGLYVVRGVAVLWAAAAAGLIGGPFAIITAMLVTLFLMPVAALAALALGLTDTLMDWRRRLAQAVQKP